MPIKYKIMDLLYRAMVIIFMVMIFGFLFLYVERDEKLFDIMFAIVTIEVVTLVFVVLPIFHHSLKSDLEPFLDRILDPDFLNSLKPSSPTTNRRENESIFIQKKQLLYHTIFWVLFPLFFGVLYSLLPLINFLTSEADTRLHNLENHVWTVPYYSEIPTETIYYLIYSVEAPWLYCATLTHVLISQSFSIITAYRVNNKVCEYCKNFRQVFTEISSELEQNDREINRENLENRIHKHVSLFADDYEDFLKTTEHVQLYMDIYSSFTALGNGFYNFGHVIKFLSETTPPIIKIQQICGIILLAQFLYKYSLVGQLYEDMHEAIIYEVYNIPWYHLTPKLRKLVNILQLQVSKTSYFQNLIIYPLDMKVFPRVMKESTPTAIKIQQICGIILLAQFLYQNSLVGQLYEDMHEAIIYEVYNIPWYHFTPKLRKAVNILQMQVSKTSYFQNFIIFPLDMKVFPRVMKVIYSFSNMLHQMTR